MNPAEPTMETRVRLFPDQADTVIWFCIGSMSYDEARVSPGLQRELQAWDQSFDDGTDQTNYTGWRSPAQHKLFVAEGLRLAWKLADELGEEFEVELWDEWGPSAERPLFRSPGKATNIEAAAAFAARAERFLEFQLHVKSVTDAGGSFGWR